MGSRGAVCGPACIAPDPKGHWSDMHCVDADKRRDHQAHIWDGQFTIYGPYYCEGHGFQIPPADPPQKEYTNDPVEAYIIDGDLDSMRHRADITDDDVAWERTVTYSKWRRVDGD